MNALTSASPTTIEIPPRAIFVRRSAFFQRFPPERLSQIGGKERLISTNHFSRDLWDNLVFENP
jgi:hypothetical protein